jgi:chromosome partitioning protein
MGQGNKMKILAVTNRKGGVGKSTIAAHTAAGLATLGMNVALVDTDSQGHAGYLMGMPHENGLYNALIEKWPLEEIVRFVSPEKYSTPDVPSRGNLFLLPSHDRTYRIPYLLEQHETFLFLQTMEAMGAQYNLDAVVVDTNPTLNLFDGSIHLAADGFIYVTECEMMSLEGVSEAIRQLQMFQTQRRQYLGRPSRIVGIIPNKMRADTRLHRHNISVLGTHYPGLVWLPVMLRIIWAEAANSQELVYTYAPSGEEARDAWGFVKRTREALESWDTVSEHN